MGIQQSIQVLQVLLLINIILLHVMNSIQQHFPVELIVIDTLGCTDTFKQPVKILCEQIADFEDNDFCYLDQNGNVNTPSFTNTSSPLDQNNPYTNYVKWEVYDPLVQQLILLFITRLI